MESLKTTVCPECGHVLHNLGYSSCPDCGFPFEAGVAPNDEDRELLTAAAAARRTGRIVMGAMLLLLLGSLLGLSSFSAGPGQQARAPGMDIFSAGSRDVTLAKNASVKANMHSLQTMIETYAVDWGGMYPESLSQLEAEATLPGRAYFKDFSNPVTAARGVGPTGAMAEASLYTPGGELRGLALYEARAVDGGCVTGYRITGTDPEGNLLMNPDGSQIYALEVAAEPSSQRCGQSDSPVLLGNASREPEPEPSLNPESPLAGSLASSPVNPGSTAPAAAASPVSPASVQADDVESTLRSWQAIKREAFLNEDDSRLSEILSDAALDETRGGLKWWADNEARYRDIELHELRILSRKDLSDSQTEAEVEISETKDNSVQGRSTSTYKATYTLEKRDGRWYISRIQAD